MADLSARELWRGTGVSVIRTVPGAALYFLCLSELRSLNLFPSSPLLNSLAAGAVARSAVGVVAMPVTVAKTRIESGAYAYRGTRHALQTMVATEGVGVLFRGLWPTVLRDAPFAGCYLLLYDATRSHFARTSQRHVTDLPVQYTVAAAAMSGFIATALVRS